MRAARRRASGGRDGTRVPQADVNRNARTGVTDDQTRTSQPHVDRHRHRGLTARDRQRARADHRVRPRGGRVARARRPPFRRGGPVRVAPRRRGRRPRSGRSAARAHRQSRPRAPQRRGAGRVPRHRGDLPAARHEPLEPGHLPHRRQPRAGRSGRAGAARAGVRVRAGRMAGRPDADRIEHRGPPPGGDQRRRVADCRPRPRGVHLQRRRASLARAADLSGRIARRPRRDALGPRDAGRAAGTAGRPGVALRERSANRDRPPRRLRRRRHLRVHLPGPGPDRARNRLRRHARRRLVPALRDGRPRRERQPSCDRGRSGDQRSLARHLPERAHAARLPVPGLQRGRRRAHRLRRHPPEHRRVAQDVHQLRVRPAGPLAEAARGPRLPRRPVPLHLRDPDRPAHRQDGRAAGALPGVGHLPEDRAQRRGGGAVAGPRVARGHGPRRRAHRAPGQRPRLPPVRHAARRRPRRPHAAAGPGNVSEPDQSAGAGRHAHRPERRPPRVGGAGRRAAGEPLPDGRGRRPRRVERPVVPRRPGRHLLRLLQPAARRRPPVAAPDAGRRLHGAGRAHRRRRQHGGRRPAPQPCGADRDAHRLEPAAGGLCGRGAVRRGRLVHPLRGHGSGAAGVRRPASVVGRALPPTTALTCRRSPTRRTRSCASACCCGPMPTGSSRSRAGAGRPRSSSEPWSGRFDAP